MAIAISLLHANFISGGKYDNFEDPAMVMTKELLKKIRKKYHLRLVKG